MSSTVGFVGSPEVSTQSSTPAASTIRAVTEVQTSDVVRTHRGTRAPRSTARGPLIRRHDARNVTRCGGAAPGSPSTSERSGGMYARSTTIRGNPQQMDDGIAYVRDKVMPAIQQMDGSVGLSMFANRAS